MLVEAKPGAFEGAIAGAGVAAILRGGGDMPPSGPVMGSGDRALLVRSATGYRHLDAEDQLTMEFAGSYRHYCACLMRTVAIGKGTTRQRRMFDATLDAITAMTEAARPGNTLGNIDDAHRRVYDAAGYGESRMSSPAATRWAPRSGRAGWTCPRCSTAATSSPARRGWCCSSTRS